MLLVNSKTLPTNANKDHELFLFVDEYKKGVNELQARFPLGVISLKRNGYPRLVKGTIGDRAVMLPEAPSPIFIKLTSKPDANGAVWGYCKSRPLIHPNGLVEVPPNDNSETINAEVYHIDLKGKPDYAFFIMYKSGLLGSEYSVFDPEGDKLAELKEKSNRMAVTNAIWSNMEDSKIRMMAQAEGIKGAGTNDILLVKEALEKKIFAKEDLKQKEKTNLQLRGINEFLADARNDEFTRPKALIQTAIEDKRITYDRNHFYFDGNDLCHVPFGKEDPSLRQEWLAQFFRDPQNKEVWLTVLKGLLTKEQIEKMDKYGIRWICTELGLPTNKKEEVLRENLLAEFTQ